MFFYFRQIGMCAKRRVCCHCVNERASRSLLSFVIVRSNHAETVDFLDLLVTETVRRNPQWTCERVRINSKHAVVSSAVRRQPAACVFTLMSVLNFDRTARYDFRNITAIACTRTRHADIRPNDERFPHFPSVVPPVFCLVTLA